MKKIWRFYKKNSVDWGRVLFDQNFRKFRFNIEWNRKFLEFAPKISFHFSRLSFFLETWKFRKCPVPFGISTRYESSPVPFWSWKATRWQRDFRFDATLDAKWSASVRACSWLPIWKIVDWSFRVSCGSARRVYVCILSPEKSSQVGVVLITRKWCLSRSGKYQGTICSNWLWTRVKILSMEQLTALKAASFPWSFSILSGKMCSTRSVRPGGKYRSIRHTANIRKFKLDFLVEWNASTVFSPNKPLL